MQISENGFEDFDQKSLFGNKTWICLHHTYIVSKLLFKKLGMVECNFVIIQRKLPKINTFESSNFVKNKLLSIKCLLAHPQYIHYTLYMCSI